MDCDSFLRCSFPDCVRMNLLMNASTVNCLLEGGGEEDENEPTATEFEFEFEVLVMRTKRTKTKKNTFLFSSFVFHVFLVFFLPLHLSPHFAFLFHLHCNLVISSTKGYNKTIHYTHKPTIICFFLNWRISS